MSKRAAARVVADRVADRLFQGRKGHASTEGVSYRNLTRDSVRDIAEAAYLLGWDHAVAAAKNAAKGE